MYSKRVSPVASPHASVSSVRVAIIIVVVSVLVTIAAVFVGVVFNPSRFVSEVPAWLIPVVVSLSSTSGIVIATGGAAIAISSIVARLPGPCASLVLLSLPSAFFAFLFLFFFLVFTL